MSSGRRTILAVNDDRSQLRLARRLLERAGYRVASATSVKEAVAVLEGPIAVDGIVSDLHMPDLDGWRFCRLLRSPDFPDCNRLPILIVSATFAGEEASRLTAELGANDFLPAPYAPEEFVRRVRDMLAGRKPEVRPRVLLVEPDARVADALRRSFAAHGYDAAVETSPERACDRLGASPHEVLVFDAVLGEKAGAALLRRIKRPGCTTVAIVTGLRPGSGNGLAWLLRGADVHLTGTPDPEQLNALCDSARRQRALLRVEELLEERTRRLNDSEARLKSILDAVPQTLILANAARRIRYVNAAFERTTGYLRREALGKRFALLRGERSEQEWEELLHAVEAGAAWEGRLYRRRKDGDYFLSEGTCSPVRGMDGTLVGWVSVYRDISQQVELERALLQSQKMEALGTLAGGLAHDFNNLLTGMLGYAGLIRRAAEKGSETAEMAAQVEASAERAAELTKQLLGFARRGKYRSEPIDLNRAVKGQVPLLSRTIGKSFRIVTRLAGSDPTIMGDPTQIEQAILNLAINARDALEGVEHPELILATDTFEMDQSYCDSHPGARPGRFAVISVTDNGCGFPGELAERIFEPFFTTKPPGKGTGMGLAMVYGITKNHGGTVRAYSEVGRGTTFRIYLPLSENGETAAAQAEFVEPVRGTGRVLIIDDEEVVRRVAASLLRGLGYQTIAFEKAEEAVLYYRHFGENVDVVLIDMVMPGMDGHACFKALKEIDPKVRAVLCTGYDLNEAAQAILDEGVAAFVRKPYRMGELSLAVAQAARS